MKDEELLDTVTYLVEDPHILVCEFQKEFLKIPDIVLVFSSFPLFEKTELTLLGFFVPINS